MQMQVGSTFVIKQQVGRIFKAFDTKLNKFVALKVEKEDKSKKILQMEFEILKKLQGLPNFPKVYDYITGDENEANFIVMELLGKNVSNYKKTNSNFSNSTAIKILIGMLSAIEQLHDKGFIHRDIKPTNFVMKEDEFEVGPDKSIHTSLSSNVYMVDYGLAKLHLDRDKNVLPARKDTDFRGTLTYASLNAHYKKELSRRDDLVSFFFVILDLLNEALPWRYLKDEREEIMKKKEFCLENPKERLLLTSCNNERILQILKHIKSLNYEDKPDYKLIKTNLQELYFIELAKTQLINKKELEVNDKNTDNKIDNLSKNFKTPISDYNNYYYYQNMETNIKPNDKCNFNYPITGNKNIINSFINNYQILSDKKEEVLISKDKNLQKKRTREEFIDAGNNKIINETYNTKPFSSSDKNNELNEYSINRIIDSILDGKRNNSNLKNYASPKKFEFCQREYFIGLDRINNTYNNNNYFSKEFLISMCNEINSMCEKYNFNKNSKYQKSSYHNESLYADQDLVAYIMKNLDKFSSLKKNN